MIYWLMDLRYREIASEWLYCHYLTLRAKEDQVQSRCTGTNSRRAEREYDDLHMRMAIFDPNVKQLKREDGKQALQRTRAIV